MHDLLQSGHQAMVDVDLISKMSSRYFEMTLQSMPVSLVCTGPCSERFVQRTEDWKGSDEVWVCS